MNTGLKIKKDIPKFPRSLRDEILNYTDDKDHRSFIKLLDSPTMFKILMGAKNVSKSFGCMIETIFRIINEPNYCAVWCRNLYKDILNTVKSNFEKALNFLKIEHNLDYTNFFDVYNSVVVFKPTEQAIYFANFEKPNSFAGLTTKKNNFEICDIFLDEIQQNPDELNDTSFSYEKQKKDLDFIIQSTILRTNKNPNYKKRVIFTFNIYDSGHWVCENFVKKIMPFSEENKNKLLFQNFLFCEDKDLNCSVLRLSRFYVPKNTISDLQLEYYEKLKINDPKLYGITIAGDPYDLETKKNINPFKRFILNDQGDIQTHLIYRREINKTDFQIFIDGFDPGIRDKNGLCRIGITNDFKIIVLFIQEISSKNFSNFKRFTSLEYIISIVYSLNKILDIENSILAIDSKEDVIIELALKYCLENKLNIQIIKAIKNKNKNFPINFSISDRVNFIKNCFEKQLILFTPSSLQLLDYLAKITFDENWNRNEKLNTEIYDLINAFEYALSIIYHIIITNHFS